VFLWLLVYVCHYFEGTNRASRIGDFEFSAVLGKSGDIIQKFVDYRLRLAILGDISEHVTESKSLRDFVYEANRGTHFCFVENLEELDTRLKRAQPREA